MISLIQKLKNLFETFLRNQLHKSRLKSYIKSDKRPHIKGYAEFRDQYLTNIISDNNKLNIFNEQKVLPNGFGYRLDARVVEIPWVLSKFSQSKEYLLDAGSSLNQKSILSSSIINNKKTTIVTLAPERECHWELGVSYIYDDLRNLSLRDEFYDIVTCISTIEHVGMNNKLYTGESINSKTDNAKDCFTALSELKRVLKPKGSLYITFPFGKYENHGWFQQFDSNLADSLIEHFSPSHFNETVFHYKASGWELSNREETSNCEYFDPRITKYFDPESKIEYAPDYPAGERAVMCLELFK